MSLFVGHAAADPTDFDVTGVYSYDLFQDSDNQVYFLNVGTAAQITSVSWDVTIFADDPSYLPEASLAISNTAVTRGKLLAVGASDDAPGATTYSGSRDLLAEHESFSVDADGLLRLEFFEALDDYQDDWDAKWLSGTLTFGVGSVVTAVPEPGSYALVLVGLAAVGHRTRRRLDRRCDGR